MIRKQDLVGDHSLKKLEERKSILDLFHQEIQYKVGYKEN